MYIYMRMCNTHCVYVCECKKTHIYFRSSQIFAEAIQSQTLIIQNCLKRQVVGVTDRDLNFGRAAPAAASCGRCRHYQRS